MRRGRGRGGKGRGGRVRGGEGWELHEINAHSA